MTCVRPCPLFGAAPCPPGPLRLQVVGLLREPGFHSALCAAQTLRLSFASSFADPTVIPLLEFAWNEYLEDKKKELKGSTWGFSSGVMCFVNGQLLGDEKALIRWASGQWGYQDLSPLSIYQDLAEDFSSKYMQSTKNYFVYLDIAIDDEPTGRLLFELFTSMCPKTCENFQALCGSPAVTSPTGQELNFQGTIFHRIVKNGWIQGGGIPPGTGKDESIFGGTFEGIPPGTGKDESIFGGTFEDESFAVPHNKRGILGMANKGHHTNGSQFYITLQATPYMDRKYVAFGWWKALKFFGN